MSAFSYELAAVLSAVTRVHPGPEGAYAIPWYLVIGHPGSGRTSAVRAMSLTWDGNESPVATGAPAPLCTYWMPKEAVFIEPERQVLGQDRQAGLLGELCTDLKTLRPREALDGILLVLNVADFIDFTEGTLDTYSNGLRKFLVEVGQALGEDVPTYVVLTRYDTLWGFAEVFQWNHERKREEPWGFTLPPDTPSQDSLKRIEKELDGLNARFESFCIERLSSEDLPEHRIRAFQHLAEVRALILKLKQVFTVLGMANAYERAPWFRALAVGSAQPGTGDKMRAGVQRFFNMGLTQGPSQLANRPGGLPFHAFTSTVLLAEKDIVPTKKRWRDDMIIIICFVVGGLLWLGAIVTGIVFASMGPQDNKPAPIKTTPAKTAPKK